METEQMKAQAKLMGEYFAELLNVGFKREEALHMTVSFQEISMMKGEGEDAQPAG